MRNPRFLRSHSCFAADRLHLWTSGSWNPARYYLQAEFHSCRLARTCFCLRLYYLPVDLSSHIQWRSMEYRSNGRTCSSFPHWELWQLRPPRPIVQRTLNSTSESVATLQTLEQTLDRMHQPHAASMASLSVRAANVLRLPFEPLDATRAPEMDPEGPQGVSWSSDLKYLKALNVIL